MNGGWCGGWKWGPKSELESSRKVLKANFWWLWIDLDGFWWRIDMGKWGEIMGEEDGQSKCASELESLKSSRKLVFDRFWWFLMDLDGGSIGIMGWWPDWSCACELESSEKLNFNGFDVFWGFLSFLSFLRFFDGGSKGVPEGVIC